MGFAMGGRRIHAIQGEGGAFVFLTFAFRMGNHPVGTMFRTMGGTIPWNAVPRLCRTSNDSVASLLRVLAAAIFDVHHSGQGMTLAVERFILSFVVERRLCGTSNESVASLLGVLTAATFDVHHARQRMGFAVEGGLLSFVVERRVCRTSNDSVASLLGVLTAATLDVHHSRQRMGLAVEGGLLSFVVEIRSCRASRVLTAAS